MPPLGLSHVGRSRSASSIPRLSRSHIARAPKLFPIPNLGDSYCHAARVLPVSTWFAYAVLNSFDSTDADWSAEQDMCAGRLFVDG